MESPSIRHLLSCDEMLMTVIFRIGDIEYTLHRDGFAFFVDTIISQMLSNKAADAISARVNGICDSDISPERVGALTVSDLRKTGLSVAKSEYVLHLASHCIGNPEYFDSFHDKPDKVVMDELMKLRGIGSWSAKMFLIFVLDRPDVLPFEDGAFRQAFLWLHPTVTYTEKTVSEKCQLWRPYASIASRYLYKVLDSGLTKQPFSDFQKTESD